MKPVIYNISNLRAPLTGIGHYAWQLIHGAMERSLSLHIADSQLRSSRNDITRILGHLNEASDVRGNLIRSSLAKLPGVRTLAQTLYQQRFKRIMNSSELDAPLIHNICYAPSDLEACDLVTIFDISHRISDQYHPRHRVKYLENLLSRLSNSNQSVITISESVKQELCNEYNIDPNRVYVTPLAASPAFKPRDSQRCNRVLNRHDLEYKSYILCVATHEPRKNLQGAVDSYLQLPNSIQRRYPLVLVGAQGWMQSTFSRALKDLVAKGLVRYLGYVPQSELPHIMSGAVLFVYPSFYEGFGLPPLEAMQSGVPCITSNTGALREVASESAHLVDPNDSNQISQAMQELLDDKNLRRHYANLGVSRAQSYSWSKTVEKTWAIYQQYK